jgi:hypothetical protein
MEKFARAILTLDRRIIYFFVALFVFGPLIWPLGLSFRVTREVQDAFDLIDGLPAGEVIVISNDYGAASMPETHPMYLALLHQCFRKGLKPIILTMVPDGPGITSIGLREVLQSTDATGNLLYPDIVDGTDYAYLGFKPNATAAILGLTEGFVGTFPTDYNGASTASLPIFQQARRLEDVGAVFCIASVALPEYWVNYGTERTGVPLLVCCTAVSGTQYYPYYQAGQFKGLVNGMKGSAEYEKLVGVADIVGQPGGATRGMDAQSIVHVFLVLAIIVANIAIIIERRSQNAAAGGRP